MDDPIPMQVPPVRVLLVDPDERVRASLAGMLGIGQRLDVVGSAGRVAEALALVQSERPAVVVLDPRLPELEGGRTLIARLREVDPEIRILVMGFSDALEDPDLISGADAFIRKTYRPGELVSAVLNAAGQPSG